VPKTVPAVYICGGDFTASDRGTCANSLHDWPQARGYVDASEQAARRLRTGWRNLRCPDCHFYGWRPGRVHETDTRVVAQMRLLFLYPMEVADARPR
jgi:hypothetical protein